MIEAPVFAWSAAQNPAYPRLHLNSRRLGRYSARDEADMMDEYGSDDLMCDNFRRHSVVLSIDVLDTAMPGGCRRLLQVSVKSAPPQVSLRQ